MSTGSYSNTFGGGGWEGYGRYLKEKTHRINQQFKEKYYVENTSIEDQSNECKDLNIVPPINDIFKHCIFWLDGRTRTPEFRLKELMIKHGGEYESYNLSRVTHIVADNLAVGNKKWRQIRDNRPNKQFHVVTSEWILGSVQKGERINESLFIPKTLQNRSEGFGSIHQFINSKDNEKTVSSIMLSGTSIHDVSPKALIIGEKKNEVFNTIDELTIQQSDGMKKHRSLIDEYPYHLKDTLDTNDQAIQSSPIELTSDRDIQESVLLTDETNNHHQISFINETLDQEPPQHRTITLCTDNDMHFVENFFKASRLHFIGRWRERILSKFSILPFAPINNDYMFSKFSKHTVRQKEGCILRNQSILNQFLVKGSSDTTILPQSTLKSQKTVSGKTLLNDLPSEILHIDFDAFFVSVALLKYPHLKTSPIAVAHGNTLSHRSGSEIASCNYIARNFGIKKGMWMGTALTLCPNLITLPYDFEGIDKASEELFHILTTVTTRVLPMSCDEAYLQLVGPVEMQYSIQIAQWIQQEVLKRTGCRVSIGIGPNILLAKLCGHMCKPSNTLHGETGIYRVPFPIPEFMKHIQLKDLPGIGHKAVDKLNTAGLLTCDDVLKKSNLQDLQLLLGKKNGETCYHFCSGCDPRPLPVPQSGIGTGDRTLTVSVNWGIRLTTPTGIKNLLLQIAQECYRRLQKNHAIPTDVTLKILRRSFNAPIEPAKYGGCGECDEFTFKQPSNTIILDSIDALFCHLYDLWNRGIAKDCPIPDIRGITVMMSKMKSIASSSSTHQDQILIHTNDKQHEINNKSPIRLKRINTSNQNLPLSLISENNSTDNQTVSIDTHVLKPKESCQEFHSLCETDDYSVEQPIISESTIQKVTNLLSSETNDSKETQDDDEEYYYYDEPILTLCKKIVSINRIAGQIQSFIQPNDIEPHTILNPNILQTQLLMTSKNPQEPDNSPICIDYEHKDNINTSYPSKLNYQMKETSPFCNQVTHDMKSSTPLLIRQLRAQNPKRRRIDPASTRQKLIQPREIKLKQTTLVDLARQNKMKNHVTSQKTVSSNENKRKKSIDKNNILFFIKKKSKPVKQNDIIDLDDIEEIDEHVFLKSFHTNNPIGDTKVTTDLELTDTHNLSPPTTTNVVQSPKMDQLEAQENSRFTTNQMTNIPIISLNDDSETLETEDICLKSTTHNLLETNDIKKTHSSELFYSFLESISSQRDQMYQKEQGTYTGICLNTMDFPPISPVVDPNNLSHPSSPTYSLSSLDEKISVDSSDSSTFSTVQLTVENHKHYSHIENDLSTDMELFTHSSPNNSPPCQLDITDQLKTKNGLFSRSSAKYSFLTRTNKLYSSLLSKCGQKHVVDKQSLCSPTKQSSIENLFASSTPRNNQDICQTENKQSSSPLTFSYFNPDMNDLASNINRIMSYITLRCSVFSQLNSLNSHLHNQSTEQNILVQSLKEIQTPYDHDLCGTAHNTPWITFQQNEMVLLNVLPKAFYDLMKNVIESCWMCSMKHFIFLYHRISALEKEILIRNLNFSIIALSFTIVRWSSSSAITDEIQSNDDICNTQTDVTKNILHGINVALEEFAGIFYCLAQHKDLDVLDAIDSRLNSMCIDAHHMQSFSHCASEILTEYSRRQKDTCNMTDVNNTHNTPPLLLCFLKVLEDFQTLKYDGQCLKPPLNTIMKCLNELKKNIISSYCCLL